MLRPGALAQGALGRVLAPWRLLLLGRWLPLAQPPPLLLAPPLALEAPKLLSRDLHHLRETLAPPYVWCATTSATLAPFLVSKCAMLERSL